MNVLFWEFQDNFGNSDLEKTVTGICNSKIRGRFTRMKYSSNLDFEWEDKGELQLGEIYESDIVITEKEHGFPQQIFSNN